jgi:hypothetical protein
LWRNLQVARRVASRILIQGNERPQTIGNIQQL